MFEHSAKEHEEKDVGEHNLEGNAKNALRVQVGLRDNARPVVSAVGKEPVGQEIAKSGVEQEGECEQGQGEANGAPRGFEDEREADEADDVIEPVFESRAIAEGLVVEPEKLKPDIGLDKDVPKAEDDREHEKEIEEGKGFWGMDRIFEKDEAQAEQREDRELRLGRELGMVDFK